MGKDNLRISVTVSRHHSEGSDQGWYVYIPKTYGILPASPDQLCIKVERDAIVTTSLKSNNIKTKELQEIMSAFKGADTRLASLIKISSQSGRIRLYLPKDTICRPVCEGSVEAEWGRVKIPGKVTSYIEYIRLPIL